MSGALDSDRVLVTALAKGEDEDALLDAWFNGVDGNERSSDETAADALGATKWSQSVSHHAV